MDTADPTKVCLTCSKRLPLTDFYQIKSRSEKSARWEKICKSCKRASLKSKRSEETSTPSSRISDQYKKALETAAQSPRNTLDFSHWDRQYGRKLSQVECDEIYFGLTAFFNLLAGEVLKE